MNNTNTIFKRNSLDCLIALALVTTPPAALGQQKTQTVIAGISVQPPQAVLSPAGSSINQYPAPHGVLASLADEHSTIFPPGTLPGHQHDYVFFGPSGAEGERAGVVVLKSSGPDQNGAWTLDFAPDYDTIALGATLSITDQQIFGPPLSDQCPPIAPQDMTFDLNYAAAGSVILDPTREPSTQLLMIYEGTNLCLNKPAGKDKNGTKGFYATLGVATSEDFGKLWPVYRKNLGSTTLGPQAPAPASPPIASFGNQVCVGEGFDACNRTTSPTYGRYPIVSPHYSMQDVIQNPLTAGNPLSQALGEQAPSAFVDSIHPASETYVYVIHNHRCPKPLCATDETGLAVSRARLEGDAPLQFENWSNGAFRSIGSPQASPGIGGDPSPILPASTTPSQSTHAACLDPAQGQAMGSISYVPETNQYLMIFLCVSDTDFSNPPKAGPSGDPQQKGAAWFYSTLDASQYDLSRQDKWSTPVGISGSWHWLDSNGSTDPNPYCVYGGWYPSFMSLGAPSGYLSTTGYAFSMDGCTDGPAGRPRYYRSRAFNISFTTAIKSPSPTCPGDQPCQI